jgi:CTP:molybdopterin cytidylyltransferase MocA
VRVLVILGEARFVGMVMDVDLPVVAVFVLVFHVLVLMQDVGMRMRHISVGVLVGVWCGHLPCSFLCPYWLPILHALRGPLKSFFRVHLNAHTLQLTRWRRCLFCGFTYPWENATMIAGLLLAAGAGRRYGMPKALVEGGAWLRRAVAALSGGGCDPVLVVLGAQADRVAPLVPQTASIVLAADWAEGMGASLRAGLAELIRSAPPQVQAALVHLVDLPDVDASVVRRLAALADPAVVARATFASQPGHPVLLGRQHWAEVISSAQGDRGARDWLAGRSDLIVVDCSDLASGIDVDRPQEPPPGRPGSH